MTVSTVSPRELHERREAGRNVALIDVRTPVEYAGVHAEGARSVPLDDLDPAAVMKDCPDGELVYVICQSGSRGRTACERIRAAGFESVVNVEGGTRAWEEAGLPVVRGRKVMSLERQVRIAAGSLVLVGVLLGAFVHPAFLGLAGFVGAGLVFAGITDTCGMGMMLARAPWNRTPTAASGKAPAKTDSNQACPT